MVIAKVSVSGVIARPTYRSKIPQGIVGATVEFDYTDPMWAGLKKTVIFWSSAVKDILDVGESVVVPPEVVAKAGCRLRVGIYGVDLSGKMVIPTLWADLGPVMSSANPGLDSSGNNDRDWAQMQAQIGDLAELQTKTKESIVAAINELAEKSSNSSGDMKGVVRSVNGKTPDENGNVEISIPESGGNVDLTGYVKSVNGVSPDKNGNVEIDIPSDDHINSLINTALGVIENGTY